MPDQTQEQKSSQPQEQKSSQPTSQGMSETTKGEPDETKAVLHQIGDTTVDTMKKPTTIAAIAGAAAVVSAVTFGVLETAVGGAAAYLAYRMLRRRRTEATTH